MPKIKIVIKKSKTMFEVLMNDYPMESFKDEFSAYNYGKKVFDLHKKSAVLILRKGNREKVLDRKGG